MPGCDVVPTRPPQVSRDDDGTWMAEQEVECRKCNGCWYRDLAEGVTWPEAIRAALEAHQPHDAARADTEGDQDGE